MTCQQPESSLTIAAIGDQFKSGLINYLQDTWVLSGEAVDFPLPPEQEERLLNELNVQELERLYGYLECISNFLDEDVHGADQEAVLTDFWMAVLRLQSKAGASQIRKMAAATQANLKNWRDTFTA